MSHIKVRPRLHNTGFYGPDDALQIKNSVMEYFDWRWGGNWNEVMDYQHFEKLVV